jgi:hypothetical protein
VSSFESRINLAYENNDASEPASIARDLILRAIGVVVLLGIGVMHFVQIGAAIPGTPLLAGAFVVLCWGVLVVAVRLVTHGDRLAWVGSGLIGAGAIAGYVFTRVLNTPFDNQDVGNWSCMLGLAALFVDSSLLAFSGCALSARRMLQGRAVPATVAVAPARQRAAV